MRIMTDLEAERTTQNRLMQIIPDNNYDLITENMSSNVLICSIFEFLEYYNDNLSDITTPLKVEVLQKLLVESGYDQQDTRFLVTGFTQGFDIG